MIKLRIKAGKHTNWVWHIFNFWRRFIFFQKGKRISYNIYISTDSLFRTNDLVCVNKLIGYTCLNWENIWKAIINRIPLHHVNSERIGFDKIGDKITLYYYEYKECIRQPHEKIDVCNIQYNRDYFLIEVNIYINSNFILLLMPYIGGTVTSNTGFEFLIEKIK